MDRAGIQAPKHLFNYDRCSSASGDGSSKSAIVEQLRKRAVIVVSASRGLIFDLLMLAVAAWSTALGAPTASAQVSHDQPGRADPHGRMARHLPAHWLRALRNDLRRMSDRLADVSDGGAGVCDHVDVACLASRRCGGGG